MIIDDMKHFGTNLVPIMKFQIHSKIPHTEHEDLCPRVWIFNYYIAMQSSRFII